MTTQSARRIFALAFAAMVALPGRLPAQTFPDASEFPRGVVLDERSQAIHGARIALVITDDVQNPWARAVAQRLAAAPLPTTRSQKDGTFVLPIVPELRPLGSALTEFNSPRGLTLWLIVEHDDFLPWREPLHQGLGGYLGSRVLLRRRVEGDPFAEVPWPPALPQMDYPWTVLGARHPAADATREGPLVDAAPKRALTNASFRIVDSQGGPVDRAELLFENGAYAAGGDLPLRTDAEGRARAVLPAGDCLLRVFAPRCSNRAVTFEVPERSSGEVTLEVPRGEWVDLVAIGRDGRPVPFVGVPIVAPGIGPRGGMPPFGARADSEGRIRCNVGRRDAYIAYSDEDTPAGRSLAIPLDAEDERRRADGAILVPKFRPVTLIVHADRLRSAGELRRVTDGGGETMQGFVRVPTGREVVTRLLTREHREIWIRQRGVAPIVLRTADLPPPGPEPLLALGILDRTLRKRAELTVTSAGNRTIRRLAVEPDWQARMREDLDAESRFNRGRGDGLELWARDQHVYDLVVVAQGHASAPLTLPARGEGPQPQLRVRLETIE